MRKIKLRERTREAKVIGSKMLHNKRSERLLLLFAVKVISVNMVITVTKERMVDRMDMTDSSIKCSRRE